MSGYGPNPWVQLHWDWRAAANFMLGGSGAGLLVASALADAAPATQLLALAMIAAGLAAVWLEIGRKLRAAHVFFNPRTSWMTRESLAAVLVFGLGIAALSLREPWLALALALVALVFLWCQARILRASKGIPAWRAPQIVPLVIATGLAEGAGISLMFSAQSPLLALFALALLMRAFAWSRYRAALKQPRSAAVLDPAGKAMLQLGTVLPLALLLLTPIAAEAVWFAGLAALATGWWFKFVLVTRAAHNQGFSLQQLPIR